MNRRKLTQLVGWLRSRLEEDLPCPLTAEECGEAAEWIESKLPTARTKSTGKKPANKQPQGDTSDKGGIGISASSGKKPAPPTPSAWAKLFTDGACRGNPGQSAAGFVIYLDGEELFTKGEPLGIMTNNQAEYHALLIGLKAVRQLGFHNVEIAMDSELIVRQLEGRYKVKNAALKPIYEQVRLVLFDFKSWRIGHVPREENKIADALANLALDSL